jgi:alpha-N-acetylglucosaminidase
MPRPAWFDSTSSLYASAAAYYYAQEAKLFGPVAYHDLNLDQEGGSTGGTSLADAAQGVADAMAAANPDYVWVMLAWSGPTPAELTKLDEAHLLVDCSSLSQATNAEWQGTPFGGAPWMFGEIGNFGGNTGLGGDLPTLATTMPNELGDPHRGDLVGTAYIPEGTSQNPVTERLWADMIWQSAPVDLATWIDGYAAARYGTADTAATAAWQQLLTAAYQSFSRDNSLFDAAPDLNATKASPNSKATPNPDYSVGGVRAAWADLLAAQHRLGSLSTYRYDLVDVTRQVISDQTRPMLASIRTDVAAGDVTGFQADSRNWLDLMAAENTLLATTPQFMLGTWIADARHWGTSTADRDTMEYDARRIVSVWDAKGSLTGVTDYANREWAGLMNTYYLPRWSSYFQQVGAALGAGTTPPTGIDWRPAGQQWSATIGGIPTRPTGDAVAEADAIAHRVTPDGFAAAVGG